MLRAAVCFALLFVGSATFAPLAGQQVIPHHQDQPPGPALSPAEAIAKMTMPAGFTVELVASEPDIVNPVAMTFDERGRIWITESLEYPRKQPGPGQDRVKILEDTDGDGKADKFSVFAEGLNIPSGIAVGHGGVWVANAPDILFYPDADRDGRADVEAQTVVSGFGRSDTHELPNSLTWGPDGWLYGLNGVFNHSHVKYAKENANYREDHAGWKLNCALWRIHPRTREFQIFCEGTSNPWGIAIDTEGSFFVSACVIDHLWHLVETGYYHRQGGPYPPFTWKIESIVKHKHQKAAYCGIHYFDSDAYPEQYRRKLYMGNIHGNCINVDKLQRDGSTYFGTGEPDFLTANDAWFMPVVQKTGPDGCLYILDWYDQYHCYQDANRDPKGIDRLKGRLYRVRYKETPRAKPFDFAKETDEQLIARLSAGNDFIRQTAQRVLSERRATRGFAASDPILNLAEQVVFNDAQPRVARLHAAWTVLGLAAPPDDLLMRMLRHPDATFRAWAVRCIGDHGRSDRVLGGALVQTSDDSADVKLQVAIALGKKLAGAEVSDVAFLTELLTWCGEDKLLPHIVWNKLQPLLDEHAATFVSGVKNIKAGLAPAVWATIPRATERMLASKNLDAAAIADLIQGIGQRAPAVAAECLRLIASRVQSGEIRDERLASLKKSLEGMLLPLLEQKTSPLHGDAALLMASWNDPRGQNVAKQLFADEAAEPGQRLRALGALIAGGDSALFDAVAAVLAERTKARDFHGQLLAALGRLDDPRVATVVLTAYGSLEPDAQPKAIELLTQRAAWARQLMEAVGARKFARELLNVNQVQKLLALNDKELTAAVAKHWGSVRTSRDPAREKFVAEMRQLVRSTAGDAHRGVEVFNRVCGQCHKIYGQGQEVGPDITANGRASFDQLLSNVFDPSLVIGASYQARTIRTSDGRIITGLLAEDSPQRVVLKIQGGKLETVARDDVEAMKVSELSLMPEGLEKQLKPQEIADLFAYIILDKPPSDPTARAIPGASRSTP